MVSGLFLFQTSPTHQENKPDTFFCTFFEEKAAFEVVTAWPCKYDLSDLNATGNEAAVEKLELQQEGAVISYAFLQLATA